MTKDVKHEQKNSAIGVLEAPSDHVNLDRVNVRPERPKRQYSERGAFLKFPEIPGYRTYLADYTSEVFDTEMAWLTDKGYTRVLRKEIEPELENIDPGLANSPVIVPVGTNKAGTGKGILLKIPTEWWKDSYEEQIQENNLRNKRVKSDSINQDIRNAAGIGITPGEESTTITSKIFGKAKNPSLIN